MELFLDPEVLLDLRRGILRDHRPDSCIVSTNLLCSLGRHMGIQVDPVSVTAVIFNRPFTEWTDTHPDVWPLTSEHVEEIGQLGGHMIVIGDRSEEEVEPGKWAGHLVGLVRDRRTDWVVDLSIDQAHRPQHGIEITEPVVFPCLRGWAEGKVVAEGKLDGGQRILYQAYPEDRTYESASDWRKTFVFQPFGKM